MKRAARLASGRRAATSRRCHALRWIVFLLAGGWAERGAAQQVPTTITPISLTGGMTSYSEHFDGLASSGNGAASTLPAGFGFAASDGSTLYFADRGTNSAAAVYSYGSSASFGSAAVTDRAFGTLRSGTTNSMLGVVFTNNTGSPLTSIAVSYTGEQWRLGATGRLDQLNFQYKLNNGSSTSPLTSGSFTSLSTLDFTAPVTAGTVGALDGNLAANHTAIGAVNILPTGVSVPAGQTFVLRWVDYNATGANDGLAIDDFTLTFSGAVPEPASCLGGGLLALAAAWRWRRGRRAR